MVTEICWCVKVRGTTGTVVLCMSIKIPDNQYINCCFDCYARSSEYFLRTKQDQNPVTIQRRGVFGRKGTEPPAAPSLLRDTSGKHPASVCTENEIKQQHNHNNQPLVPACSGTPHAHHSTAGVTVLHGEQERRKGRTQLLPDLF